MNGSSKTFGAGCLFFLPLLGGYVYEYLSVYIVPILGVFGISFGRFSREVQEIPEYIVTSHARTISAQSLFKPTPVRRWFTLALFRYFQRGGEGESKISLGMFPRWGDLTKDELVGSRDSFWNHIAFTLLTIRSSSGVELCAHVKLWLRNSKLYSLHRLHPPCWQAVQHRILISSVCVCDRDKRF